jgi:hypothetical protein
MTRQKKLTSKERKAQRRAELERRHGKDWQPPSVTMSNESLSNTALPLIRKLASAPDPEQQITLTVIDSEALANEPELAEIFVHPMKAAEAFATVNMKLGVTQQMLDKLLAQDEARVDEIQIKIQEGVARLVVTKELRKEIMDGLSALQSRLTREDNQDEAARVALIQMFLQSERKAESWAMVGLVQEILARSLDIGMAMLDATHSLGDTIPDDPAEFRARMEQSDAVAKTEALINSTPGLRNYLESQADHAWEKGWDAVFDGTWYLALYTEEETQTLVRLIRRAAGLPEDIHDEDEDQESSDFDQERARDLIGNVDDYLTELFTHERLEQLQTRLDEIQTDESYTQEQWMFASILSGDLKEEDALEGLKPFLMRAFFGEVRQAGNSVNDEEESFEEENYED